MNKVKEELEKFVRRYYDLEIIISPQAGAIQMSGGDNIADCLQKAIITYMLYPPKTNSEELTEEEHKVFAYMTKIISYGMVSPSSDLLGKLDAERKRNAELLRDLSISIASYTALERKYNRIAKNLDQNPSKPTEKTDDDNE